MAAFVLSLTDAAFDNLADGDGDAYGFLDTSKDRTVEIKEVEVPVKTITVLKTKHGQVSPDSKEPGQLKAEIFGLQRCKSAPSIRLIPSMIERVYAYF